MFCFVHLKDILAIFAKAKKVKLCEHNYNVCIVFYCYNFFRNDPKSFWCIFFKNTIKYSKIKKVHMLMK